MKDENGELITFGRILYGVGIAIAGLAIGGLSLLLGLFYNAIAMYWIWRWFITESYIMGPVLTYPMAVGIMMLFRSLKGFSRTYDADKAPTRLKTNWFAFFLMPILVIAMAYVVKSLL